MGYRVVRSNEHAYEERPNREGEPPRLAADVTAAAGLRESRARIWRYPPHTRRMSRSSWNFAMAVPL